MDQDSILIKKAALGDEEAFSKLIENYKNYVFAIILNFVRDYDEVENIAQEVFIQVYVSLPGYDHDNFKGWIGRIAANKSIDFLRRKKSKHKLEDRLTEEMEEDQSDSPEYQLIQKEKHDELLRAINSIPEIYRNTLTKFYFQQKSYEAIAQEENITVKTVASRLYRAKIMIREKWRDRYKAL
ncbi:MAG: sigma-70 family RNA polymerase sigma factor [Clostridiaceae bacterium]|nr:sigma-70 family RNA polymerase sigma factor [Clostridiaceae bacterium]